MKRYQSIREWKELKAKRAASRIHAYRGPHKRRVRAFDPICRPIRSQRWFPRFQPGSYACLCFIAENGGPDARQLGSSLSHFGDIPSTRRVRPQFGSADGGEQ